MHSLRGTTWLLLVSAVAVVRTAAVPPPIITPAPVHDLEAWRRQELDPVNLANILLTALPQSLRQIAATNVAAVSSILWNEFLDDKKPQWFQDLPWEIQSYLINKYGPETAWLTSSPTSASVETTASTTDSSVETSGGTSASSGASSRASSLPTRSSATPSATSARPASTLASTSSSTSTPTSSTEPDAPAANSAGLTKTQKIGMGVGIPLGILAVACLLFGCCFLLRRRRKGSRVNGSERASSPGFIPHSAFQDKSTDQPEHRVPLNPSSNQRASWDDELFMPTPMNSTQRAQTHPSSTAPGMTMQDSTPIMAPVLFHTHSSNRARGKRTSYSSLHSVAELREPGDQLESPILGRHNWPKQSLRRSSIPEHYEQPKTQTQPPLPYIAYTPNMKRKPASADLSAQSLQAPARPDLPLHDSSGSTLSELATSSPSRHNSDQSYGSDPTSPISPLSAPLNPFSNSYSYVEDFGPEYASNGYGHGHGNNSPHNGYANYSYASNDYVDIEDGLYGGHRSLDAYATPEAAPAPRRNSKTEWPLRNVMGTRRSNQSPIWDRVYDE